MSDVSLSNYVNGLHEIADGCFAYLQPDGSWGWSNAGLVVGDGASLLVDTLFDLRLTAAMLDAMASSTRTAPIGTVVNTHANGDHCYGNQLVGDAEIISSRAAAEEMSHVPPSMLAALNSAPGDLGKLFRGFFGASNSKVSSCDCLRGRSKAASISRSVVDWSSSSKSARPIRRAT